MTMEEPTENILLKVHNIYECRRGPDLWMGGLIIDAESELKAIELFKEYEKDPKEPYSTKQLQLKTGVLYDDDMR